MVVYTFRVSSSKIWTPARSWARHNKLRTVLSLFFISSSQQAEGDSSVRGRFFSKSDLSIIRKKCNDEEYLKRAGEKNWSLPSDLAVPEIFHGLVKVRRSYKLILEKSDLHFATKTHVLRWY
jgi:hypothetical protein